MQFLNILMLVLAHSYTQEVSTWKDSNVFIQLQSHVLPVFSALMGLQFWQIKDMLHTLFTPNLNLMSPLSSPSLCSHPLAKTPIHLSLSQLWVHLIMTEHNKCLSLKHRRQEIKKTTPPP